MSLNNWGMSAYIHVSSVGDVSQDQSLSSDFVLIYYQSFHFFFNLINSLIYLFTFFSNLFFRNVRSVNMYEYIFLVSKKFCFSPESIYPLIFFGISYIMNHSIEIINF